MKSKNLRFTFVTTTILYLLKYYTVILKGRSSRSSRFFYCSTIGNRVVGIQLKSFDRSFLFALLCNFQYFRVVEGNQAKRSNRDRCRSLENTEKPSMIGKVEYLEKYSVAPPPSRDYYGLKILQNEVSAMIFKDFLSYITSHFVFVLLLPLRWYSISGKYLTDLTRRRFLVAPSFLNSIRTNLCRKI